MGNPTDRTRDLTSFAASCPEIRASVEATTTSGDPDTCTRRKRVRFGQGTCSLEFESGAKAKLSDADAPKTSEYAFFKKVRKDVVKPGLPAQKERNRTDECKSGDRSDNAGVGNRISKCFQNLKFSLHAQDVRSLDSCSPIAVPSKTTVMNSVEKHDFRNSEFAHTIRKAMCVDFNASCSLLGDRVKSSVASYVYGQGNFFSSKRDKLLQLVADTYPESKDLNLNGKKLVNSMLGRLFPNGYDSKHVSRARKLRQQDTSTSWLTSYPENTTDCEKFSWPGYDGSTEVGYLLPLDYGSMSSGSTELAKWNGEYSMSPDQSTDHEQVHQKTKKPYRISDHVRSRRPWKKHLQSRLPCETFMSHTSSDMISHHPYDVPSRQHLLLGWIDENTEDEKDQLQLAPYNLHYDKSLYSNSHALFKNDYQLETNSDFSLSQIQPQIVTGHPDDIDSYFQIMDETDSYIPSDHLLKYKETKDWDTDFTNNDGDSYLLPNIFATREIISSDYPQGQFMCIDQPWEVCGKNVTGLNYLMHDSHRYRDGYYQTGYTDEPIYDQTT